MGKFRLMFCAPLLAMVFLSPVGGVSVASAASCNSGPSAGVDWTECRKRNLILTRSTLTDAKMAGADLSSTDLRDSKMDGADMTKANLLRTYLDDSTLVGADLSKAVGYRTHFEGANLTDAILDKSEMTRANFTDAILHRTDFSKAELGRARFIGAKIESANFEIANLARADFRGSVVSQGTDFSQAFLYRTRVDGLDLSGTQGLSQLQIELACGDDKTVLPDGLTPPAAWPCEDE